ncbi:MAG: AbrB/MazE/SpoVT family DNA-binding domain-containing protein [Thaumarchaeota archaeon]|nr:AbrB/MazE/SpoVT family DNA-binding domain-containing protein [Nitrososphaerota archaeon]MDG6994413.1 AbrB/MazE/SpoVT family DNA-binding domain-containing protein [Nitrososphaerota archaeon]
MSKQMKFRTIRVSEKGQISIPAEIQRELGIEKGDELLLVRKGDKILLEKPTHLRRKLSEEFKDIELATEDSLRKISENERDNVWDKYLEKKARSKK